MADQKQIRRQGRRLAWAAAGWLSLGLAVVGIVLPLLPTTPLVILAAFCFSKGSPRLRRWLIGHKTFGPIIRDWEARGAIARPIKALACSIMAMVLGVSIWAGLPGFVIAIQAICMGGAATYILTRPHS